MNTTLIIGAGVAVAGGIFLLPRRAAAAPAMLATRYQSIDRSPAGGNTAPIEFAPAPTYFETLASTPSEPSGPPPPPPPPSVGCGDGYYWEDHAVFSPAGWWSGACLQIPAPPQVQVPAPPAQSCGFFDVICKAKRAAGSVANAVKGGPAGLAKGFVDLNKAYVGYSVDQFKKGAAITGAEGKAKAFIAGQTRGAA